MKSYRTVLIMGLGLHGGGAGAANYFVSQGDRVVVTDLKTEKQLAEGIKKLKQKEKIRFVLGRHEYSDFRDADIIVKNPGVPKNSPYLIYAKEHGAVIETDVGIFLDCIREKTRNIIGVTGTKGKSTTATLIHAIIQKKHPDALVAGNITVSVLDILPRVATDTYVILELSSFQLGGIENKRFSPRLGVITNFMEDHLDYYGSMDEYFVDKSVLFRFQNSRDVIVVNRDSDVFRRVVPARGVKRISFGLTEHFNGPGIYVKKETDRDIVCFKKQVETEQLFDAGIIQLRGVHNLYNVLAASAACFSEGIGPSIITDAVSEFRGLPHRLEYVATKGGVHFINDSAATMPDAAVEGINSIEGEITLISGGSDKGLPLQKLIRTMRERVRNLVLLEGSGTRRLVEEGLNMKYVLFDDIKTAVSHAYTVSRSGATVLLSPGFASFGMFMNEFDRGNQFRDTVNNL